MAYGINIAYQSLVNQLIGAARKYKRRQRISTKTGKLMDATRHDLSSIMHSELLETGYFGHDDINKFAWAFANLLEGSSPENKKTKKTKPKKSHED